MRTVRVVEHSRHPINTTNGGTPAGRGTDPGWDMVEMNTKFRNFARNRNMLTHQLIYGGITTTWHPLGQSSAPTIYHQ
jgi:hypothetical protein